MSEGLKPGPAFLAAVAREFQIPGRFVGGAPHGSGHINDTFAVGFDQAGSRVRYIFQRINSQIFKDVPALMENIQRVTQHAAGSAKDKARTVLTLVPTSDGRFYCRDEQGAFWRCYQFIENARTYDLVEHPRQAYEAARAFGGFQRMLVDLPGGRLHETIPHFHDTTARFQTLKQTVSADCMQRVGPARADIDFALAREPMVGVLQKLKAQGEIPERITHNDTKFNNVMMSDSGRAVCVIDLDTVMPGLALDDFGDMVRSATNSAAEDEPDVSKVTMRMPFYERLVAGYVAGAGGLLNAAERAHLAFAAKLITFEIGIRFLADHLEGDRYFKIKRPGHNLDRARNQFALVRSIEQQEGEMQSVAERLTAGA